MNSPAKLKHIMILTGEPSGDLHAGNLIKQIRRLDPNIYFSGIGGQYLQNQNVNLFYNIENLSVMGLTEVIMQFKQIRQAFDLYKTKLKENRPDLLILVDYPGFNLRAAKIAKEQYNIKILYYISPKVWAWNKKRLIKIKKYIDHAALILPFEEKIYKNAGIKADYVGNPLLDNYPENISKPFLRTSPILHKNNQLTIGLLPGSRNTEVDNLFEIMVKSAELVSQKLSNKTNKKILFIVSKADLIKKSKLQISINRSYKKGIFKIIEASAKDIFLKSDLVIAASGTVTLEAALCCVPTVIIYKMSFISYHMARHLVKIKYAGLANLILDREVMPELLQNDATPNKICQKTLYMLDNLTYFENQLQMVRKKLGKKSASKRTAVIAINMI